MEDKDNQKECFVFDASKLQKLPNLPTEFKWPEEALVVTDPEELDAPLIDLEAFLRGDEKAISEAADLVRKACMKHGFFQVINHGVDPSLIDEAREKIDAVFNLPLEKKLSMVPLEPGSVEGFSVAHAHRFSSMLLWKETFSWAYLHGNRSGTAVVDYFKSVLGQDFESTGRVFQKYCEAMEKLSGVIFELLAVSLGLEDRLHFKKYFQDGKSLMRCIYYPPCDKSETVLGSAPHCDTTSLTILHQDQIGGLEVLYDNKWQAVRPRPNAFGINIGDTFMALSNGYFRSSVHRVIVNKEKVRKSLVFFVSPKDDKVVKSPKELVHSKGSRKYPDFTWPELFDYTQKHRRADDTTLPNFIDWLQSSKTDVSSHTGQLVVV